MEFSLSKNDMQLYSGVFGSEGVYIDVTDSKTGNYQEIVIEWDKLESFIEFLNKAHMNHLLLK